MNTRVPLILASGSPRRKQLLGELGLPFTVEVRPTDEIVSPGLSPAAAAMRIARTKAEAFRDRAQQALILTADTVVALGNTLLAKPADRDEALHMLQSLSGKTHEVITGCALYHGTELHTFYESTRVHFRALDYWEMEYYVDQYQPFDKAGGYGIQEWIGMVGITGIEGDFYNVMGLPVAQVWERLKGWC